MKKKLTLPFGIVLAAFGLAMSLADSSAASETDGSWERVRTEDGIVVSRKEIPGSPFVAFRGEGDVDAPILTVGNVLVDVPHEKDWIDSVVEAKVLRKVSETEYIMYSHLGMPAPLSDRDLVTDVTLTLDAQARTLTVRMRSVTDPSAPQTGYVRANLEDSVFVLASIDGGKRTHVTAEIHCDPRGSVPAWIVNVFPEGAWGLQDPLQPAPPGGDARGLRQPGAQVHAPGEGVLQLRRSVTRRRNRSRGAGPPVNLSNCAEAWPTNISIPPTVLAPAARAVRSRRVSRGL